MVSIPAAGGQRAWGSGGITGNPLRLLLSARPWIAALFLLVSFVSGTFWFSVLVTLVSTGFGLAITFLGLPILVLTMALWTWGARLERWWIARLFGVTIASPYRPVASGPLLGRLRLFVSDPAVWRDLCYLLLLFPLGIAEFVATTITVLGPLALVTLPVHLWTLHNHGTLTDPGFALSMPETAGLTLIGFGALLVMPYLLIGMARAHLSLVQALLGPTQSALAARVDSLTESRSRVMDAALAERRRIERDLHDGAQQRLVALAMNLGMAKSKLKTDPAAVPELVEAAHREAKAAMVEMRNLIQGLHPAVLTDRGLDAALSALAGRCPTPVAVIVNLEQRPLEVVESAAYFVAAEALTNVAKHSAATEASVIVQQVNDTLIIEIIDNGLGGADPSAGSGLAGLVDRVTALDGRLTVDSPPGRGTRLRAELPC